MTAADRLRKDLVMVGHALKSCDNRIVGANFGNVGDHARGARSIRVEKEDVECRRGSTQVIEAGEQFGKKGPRPRPLAETFEAVVIHFDDADGGWLVFPRLQTQEFVEDVKSELDE